MAKDSIIQLWEDYRKTNPHAPAHYEAWAFGDSKEMADQLAELVLEGRKTATSSYYTIYEWENESLPNSGLHNIILDGNGEAVAIMETTSVKVVPFDEVTEEHAFMEGDRTLRYWREVHESFFRKELKEINQDFHYKIPVVCERLKLLYKK
ncbi:ASCH domain-containing protein [Halobacillus halophilus]|uniref:ASCH domain-containing protein n=1 Tax=Halobacillus halophilus (strain ATCC 35676 / DSM 2266 / JCM 20832 / KCTC 3685 / LMG 17431 / NBRC 102448 / NCIMB 2269) TaxID=866895 RepID=I0JR56_HALH3|nr:ASCH domain-containing protein [Halobacillus halophilus]ASF40623.1 ASCH domain-containing protein [Halobacillus halophilus]CCG46626.1 hypothetical protein HBHAL_4285 [Halobacillus halophilus DSM 2266]